MNHTTLQDLLRDATRLTRAGQLSAATAVIQRALAGTSPFGESSGPPGAHHPPGQAAPPAPVPEDPAFVLEGCVFEVPDLASDPASEPAPEPASAVSPWAGRMSRSQAPPRTGPSPAVRDHLRARSPARGEFIHGSHTHASLTRGYKLFVAPDAGQRPLPLVVMLHGCTQDPDDFAAGTGMNTAALEHGFHVLYPAQAAGANPSRCWNWFKHNHQARDRGETALIAAMTRAVIRDFGIDPERVYIAGLSAGGAMASLVAAAFPDVFAAVGVHSGLAPGAARSLPEGLAAMRGGAAGQPPNRGFPSTPRSNGRESAPPVLSVPAIIFHGDHDQTVHPSNGDRIVAAVLGGHARPAASADKGRVVEEGVSHGGLRYTRTTYAADAGPAIAEHWLVHGAGHAWSGGQAAGTYTDARGPDATREMLRFFLGHSRRSDSGKPPLDR